jgi:hypothetical protein
MMYFEYAKAKGSVCRVRSHELVNRIIQEEFVDYHAHDFLELQKFNSILMEYLVWFNTERPHDGLQLPSLVSPLVRCPPADSVLW